MRKAVLCFCLLSLNLAVLAADGFAHDERFVAALLRDQQNKPRISTLVTVVEQHSEAVLETETDEQGRFALWLNPNATYLVLADSGKPQFTIHPSQILAEEPEPQPAAGTPKLTLSVTNVNGASPLISPASVVYSTSTGDVEDDPADPDDPNNGGVSVLYGDPPDNGGTNGEEPPANSHDRPKAGGVTLAGTLISDGDRLALTLTSDDLSSRFGLIRKLRLVGRFRTAQPDKLFFENLELDSELVSDGSALISIQPSATGTFDLEIEALGNASLNVNGPLLTFELVHADQTALFSVQSTFDLNFMRVEPKRGRIARYGKRAGR